MDMVKTNNNYNSESDKDLYDMSLSELESELKQTSNIGKRREIGQIIAYKIACENADSKII